MDMNQLMYMLSQLTPENKGQIFKILQLQAAQSGEPLSPELTSFFNADPGQEGEAWNSLLGSLGPKKPMTGFEGLKQSLMGQGQFGIQPHLSSLENIMQRLNAPNTSGGYNPGGIGATGSSSYMGAQQQAQQKPGYFQRGVNALGGGLKDFAPAIGAGAAGAFGPLGVLASPLSSGIGTYLENYGNNPNLRGINPNYGY